MFLRMPILRALAILCFLIGESSAVERFQLVIDEKLTLEEVFKAGFRPSALVPSNAVDVRVWEGQSIDLVFEDFIFSIDTEQTTFRLYDDDQIASLRIIGSRAAPLTIAEVGSRARNLSDGLGLKADPQIEEWLERCRARNSMVMQGFGGKEWRPGVRVGGEFFTTLQPLDQLPAVLGIEIRWKYLGTGPDGGDRWGKPVVSPPGYEWDMSYEAWSAKVRQGGSSPAIKQSQVAPPDSNPDPTVDSSRKPQPEGGNPATGKAGAGNLRWIIPVAGLVLLGFLALWFKKSVGTG